MPNDTSNPPYTVQASMPGLSSAYSASTVGSRRSSGVPTDETLASTIYYPTGPPASTSFTSPYAPQESSEATATLGLPGRASQDLSAYLNSDPAWSGSLGDGQYRRYSGLNSNTEATYFKEE